MAQLLLNQFHRMFLALEHNHLLYSFHAPFIHPSSQPSVHRSIHPPNHPLINSSDHLRPTEKTDASSAPAPRRTPSVSDRSLVGTTGETCLQALLPLNGAAPTWC